MRTVLKTNLGSVLFVRLAVGAGLLSLVTQTGAAQGTRRATFTVKYGYEVKEAYDRTGGAAFLVKEKGNRTAQWTLEATGALEIPDMDYGRESSTLFGYHQTEMIAPEYQEVHGAPRRKLPATKLVSFGGKVGSSYNAYRWSQTLGGGKAANRKENPRTCEETTTAQGGTDFQAGRPGEGTGGVMPSFDINFGGDMASVKVASFTTFPVRGEKSSTCEAKQPYSQTSDPVDALFPIQNVFMPQPLPPWTAEVKRTASGYSGTAQAHKETSIDGGTKTETGSMTFTIDLGAAWATAPAPTPQPPAQLQPPPGPGNPPLMPGGMTKTEYKQGQISFTQGGKEATWLLVQGGFTQMMGMGGGTFPFKPGSGNGSLMLSYQQMGGTPEIAALSVRSGPAGDAQYNKRQGGCSLRITQAGASGVEGSGQCQGGFQGTPITKFAFTVKP